jgi:hypothetical protein
MLFAIYRCLSDLMNMADEVQLIHDSPEKWRNEMKKNKSEYVQDYLHKFNADLDDGKTSKLNFDKLIEGSLSSLVAAVMHYAWRKACLKMHLARRATGVQGKVGPPGPADIATFLVNDVIGFNMSINDHSEVEETIRDYLHEHVSLKPLQHDNDPIVTNKCVMGAVFAWIERAVVSYMSDTDIPADTKQVLRTIKARRASAAPESRPVAPEPASKRSRVDNSTPPCPVFESDDARVHIASIVIHLVAMFKCWQYLNKGPFMESKAVREAVGHAGGSTGLLSRKSRDWYDCCHDVWGIMDKAGKISQTSGKFFDIYWRFNVKNATAYYDTLAAIPRWKVKIDAAYKNLMPIMKHMKYHAVPPIDGYKLACAKTVCVPKMVHTIK